MNELDFFLLGILMGGGIVFSFFHDVIIMGIMIRIGRGLDKEFEKITIRDNSGSSIDREKNG